MKSIVHTSFFLAAMFRQISICPFEYYYFHLFREAREVAGREHAKKRRPNSNEEMESSKVIFCISSFGHACTRALFDYSLKKYTRFFDQNW